MDLKTCISVLCVNFTWILVVGRLLAVVSACFCDVHFPRRFIGPTGQNLGVSKSRWFHVVMFQVLFIYLLFIQDN